MAASAVHAFTASSLLTTGDCCLPSALGHCLVVACCVQVFASEVAAPLGLRGTYWTNTACDERTPRNPLLGCGAISTPLDMAAFLRLLARKGQLSDGSGCLLQACTFQELVAAQSSGGGGDPVWAAVWAPRCTPPAPVRRCLVPSLPHGSARDHACRCLDSMAGADLGALLAAHWLRGSCLLHQMQALVHAGLLHISDVQYACDRWGNLAYGLGETCSLLGWQHVRVCWAGAVPAELLHVRVTANAACRVLAHVLAQRAGRHRAARRARLLCVGAERGVRWVRSDWAVRVVESPTPCPCVSCSPVRCCTDDPTWAVWACMGCRPGWFRMAGILLARAAERSWGAGRGSNIDG